MKGKPFVHLELNAPDAAKAKEFYTEMFGWEFSDMDMGPNGIYSTFRPAEAPGGGLFSAPEAPRGWLAYVGVDDIKAATEKARGLGAKIGMANVEVPHMGWLTVMEDPSGSRIAMWQGMQGTPQAS